MIWKIIVYVNIYWFYLGDFCYISNMLLGIRKKVSVLNKGISKKENNFKLWENIEY